MENENKISSENSGDTVVYKKISTYSIGKRSSGRLEAIAMEEGYKSKDCVDAPARFHPIRSLDAAGISGELAV